MNRWLKTIILAVTCLMMAGMAFQASAEETADQSINVLNINGTLISQEQFNRELANEINKDAGKSMTEEELNAKVQKVVDKIIKNELLYQECQKEGVDVSEEEINQKFDSEKSKFASEQDFQQSLKDLNKDEFIRKSEIKRDLSIQRLINMKFKPTITDKEVDKYYKKNSDKYKDIPLEQAKEDIKKQLGKEKIADSYNKFYAEVKGKATVEVMINQ